MTTTTEPARAIVANPQNPLTILERAVERGVDAAQLEKLMSLVERWQAMEATRVFGDALAGFQLECPQIPKTRPVQNRDGTLRYKFASIEDVMKVAGPILGRYKIAATYSQDMNETDVITTVRVRVGAHAEDSKFIGPRPCFEELAKAKGQSVPQNYGETLTYYKRYAFCAALGITVCGEDSDAAAADVGLQQGISEEQQRQLKSQIEAKGIDLGRFLKLANACGLDEITQANYPRAMEYVKMYKPKGGKE